MTYDRNALGDRERAILKKEGVDQSQLPMADLFEERYISDHGVRISPPRDSPEPSTFYTWDQVRARPKTATATASSGGCVLVLVLAAVAAAAAGIGAATGRL